MVVDMKKIVLICLFFCVFAFIFSISAYADDNIYDIYKDQLKSSGAEDIINKLPEEAKENLDDIGLDDMDINKLSNLNPRKIFAKILYIAQQSSYKPFKFSLVIIAIMLVCALVESMKVSFSDRPLSGVVGVVGSLLVCTSIVFPVVDCISKTSNVIKNSSDFMLCYIPVMTGIMITSGQPMSAASNHFIMVFLGNIISEFASNLLVPLLNIFLALSIVSTLSPKLNLKSFCETINSIVKWILGFLMSVFVSVLTVQNIVTTAVDSTSSKSIKFAINSCVPIVGGALSDAFNTVQSCLKLLKSGVGAFSIIAAGFIFIPIIIECLIYMISINVCVSFGEIFELKQISSLLKSINKVISSVLVMLLCVVTILIISTVLILIIGGAA